MAVDDSTLQILKQKEEEFRPLADIMEDIVWITDLNLKTTFVSKSILTILGFTPEERSRQTASEIMTPESLEVITDRLAREIAREQEPGTDPDRSLTVEVEYLHKKGHTVWMENSIKAIRDASNRFIGVLGVSRDISKRKQLDSALAAREKNYRALVDGSPDLIYRTNNSGEIIFVSPSVHRLSGYTIEEAIGMKMAQEVYAVPSEREAFLNELTQSGQVKNFQAQLKRKDGSLWWASTNAHFLKDSDDIIIGVEGATRDITDLKQAEAALKESEEKFRLAFMTSPDAISLNRLSDGSYIDVNPGFCRITGYSRDDVMGKTPQELSIWTDLWRKKFLVEELRTQGMIHNLESRFQCRDGTLRYGLMSASLLTLDQEQVILSITRDITEQKQTRELLVQSEKMLSVGGLAAGMAHEINNPLAGMLQNAQVLLRRLGEKLPANTRAAEALGVSLESIHAYMDQRDIIRLLTAIRDAGLRASTIVSNMLSFSRKSSGRLTPVSLIDLMETTISLAENEYNLNRKFDFKSIAIERRYDRSTPPVMCEGNKIQQVFFNIIKNAADAMAARRTDTEEESNGTTADPPRLIIAIARDTDDRVSVNVTDNGCGMDSETRKRIFEPFYTKKPGNLGTGLGLSVSYFIITDTHNGEIQVASSPGKGSTFTIRLPISQDLGRIGA